VRRSIIGRVFGFILLFYAVAFGAFFTYAIVSVRPAEVLPSFQREYAARRALSLFIQYLIPVHVSAVAVAFSLGSPLGARRAAGAPALPFHRLVSPALVLFIVLGVGYTALYEGISPGLQGRMDDIRQLTAHARAFEAAAAKSRAAGDVAAAVESLDLALAIDPKSARLHELRQAAEAEGARRNLKATGNAEGAQGREESAASLLTKARDALDRRDWMTAHELASQAHALEPERTDALRIAALAWAELSKLAEPKAEERDTAELYARKKEAYTRLMQDDPFTAYYRFVRLAAENPRDRDIAVYLEKSRQAVARQTFFLDEVEKAQSRPGTPGILFVNARGAGTTEVFSFDSMIEARAGAPTAVGGPAVGVYFLGIEAIRYRQDGGVDYHLAAPYGKLDGRTILLHGVHRTDQAKQSLPVYHAGARPAAERYSLELAPAVEEVRALTVDRDRSRIGLPQLWLLRGTLAAYGVPRGELTAAIAMKAVMPFLFLTLSFLAVPLGWALRARYLGRPPLRMIILVPLIPFVVSLASLLWIHAHRVILGFVVLASGLGTAMIVLALLEAAVLAVSVILMAGQST
jgi:hypothetical protein